MRIVSVDTSAISIPLEVPVADAVRNITHRDHLIVRIRTDDQLEGIGFTLGYDASVAMVSLVETIFRPILLGADAFAAEHLWAEMYRQSIQAGRRGAALRAISAIDIALWDLRGKFTRLPVMALLGVHSTRLKCYATGGYYRAGFTEDDLVREMEGYIEQGFRAVKLKVGKLSGREDAARFARIRRALGDDIDILLDANGGWSGAPAAIAAMRRLEEYRPYWIEEPVRADNLHAMAQVAEALDTPVATGELEATRWAFAELLERRAADILQPDATVAGGVSEWMKIAHLAAAFDVPIAPHYNWDIHSQLVAAIPNALFIEYFVRTSGVKLFDELLENPMSAKDGFVEPRSEPGFGLVFRDDQLERYRIA
ncbi:MAG TPA: mandelate racemase/muconate lactonizing enzyme family protein [Bryobacteraceae bacterium]|nr:mandelate racemase/muconate lactonizing enzyme family protein [Bryobacteraceae bacterium]